MSDYKSELNQYIKNTKKLKLPNDITDDRLEFQFENLKDWSVFYTFKDIEKWYQDVIDKKEMTVEEIPVKDCKKWVFGEDKIYHDSGEFFSIKGLRVKTSIRECEKGWDQPIIKQTGWDGGILGILRKRFDGIPHYLVEAKSEPGNPNMVQISPTLQATFSNINAIHLGNVPNYLDFFQNAEQHHKVHYKKWLAEDGGRLYNKRNLNMIIEVDEDYNIAMANDNFIWMSMYQIKKCLQQDAWVANSIRSIISHL
jgi:oxidase EvaA